MENRVIAQCVAKIEQWWRLGKTRNKPLRLAINKVVCKKQDSLIVQLFLNGNSIQSRSGKGLYSVVSA